jgi:hypothetical protein
MIIAEVVETKTAFKPNQKDRDGNTLPIGSIEVRIGSQNTNLGQVRNVYARPATWNRRIPLIGEHVHMMLSPANDSTSDGVTGTAWIYFSPINATDDLVLHHMPFTFGRDQGKKLPNPGQRLGDKKLPGYTFPKKPRKTNNLQPFEGDDIFEGRFGQSIRFGSTVSGDMSVYDQKPTWKSGENTDPIIIIRVKKPSGSTTDNLGKIEKQYKSLSKYTIEDVSSDESSIYMTSMQSISKLKPGFTKNADVAKLSSWSGKSQVVIDADRVVFNAKKDKAFVVGNSEVVITAKGVLFQSSKYKVYLDDLMDFLKSWLDEDKKLAAGSAQYATACGPTATATNMSSYMRLAMSDFNKFKRG